MLLVGNKDTSISYSQGSGHLSHKTNGRFAPCRIDLLGFGHVYSHAMSTVYSYIIHTDQCRVATEKLLAIIHIDRRTTQITYTYTTRTLSSLLESLLGSELTCTASKLFTFLL